MTKKNKKLGDMVMHHFNLNIADPVHRLVFYFRTSHSSAPSPYFGLAESAKDTCSIRLRHP